MKSYLNYRGRDTGGAPRAVGKHMSVNNIIAITKWLKETLNLCVLLKMH